MLNQALRFYLLFVPSQPILALYVLARLKAWFELKPVFNSKAAFPTLHEAN